MDGRIGIEAADQVEELGLGGFMRQLVQPTLEAGLFAGFPFVAHVDPAGGVVADQHGGQTGTDAVFCAKTAASAAVSACMVWASFLPSSS